MERGLIAVALLLFSGCVDSAPANSDDATPASNDSVSTSIPPGLFDASDGELRPVEFLPGLFIEENDGVTTYRLDVRAQLVDNAITILLVQPLTNISMPVSYDIEVGYAQPFNPNSDVERARAVCIETLIVEDEPKSQFYLARALGQDHPPPMASRGGPFPDEVIGHGRSGPTDSVIALFGDRFIDQKSETFEVEAGQFVRFMNGLSQLPPESVRADGNHWFQNWTMSGAHRIIRIPPATHFCASGFGEFNGGTQFGPLPGSDLTTAAFLEVETRYGSSLTLDSQYPNPDQNPANEATVDFLGKICKAGGGRYVVQDSFDAGRMRIDVARWVGHPFVVLSGFGVNQALTTGTISDEPSCPS